MKELKDHIIGLQLLFNSKWSFRFIISAIILFSIILRLKGIYWGIPTVDIPHIPFHPDEAWAMNVLKEFNLEKFNFNMHSAHREGSLSYYIILTIICFLKAIGYIHSMPNNIIGITADYSKILLAGRQVTVFFDILSVVLIYFIIKTITKSRQAPLIGMFVFAIMPFEIIYSHYMRSHIFANFFILVVIYLSVLLYENQYNNKLYFFIGLFSGFATATKYNSIIIVSMPIMIYLGLAINKMKFTKFKFPKAILMILRDKRIYLLLLALLLGFFITDPYLFLQFNQAKATLAEQASYTATKEFSLANIYNLSRLRVYVDHLIPYGTLPFLWLLLYSSTVYLLFRSKLYLVSLPFIIFLFLFLYPMAKGYVYPDFIRAALLIFPILAILVGIAFDDLYILLKNPRKKIVVWLLLIVICTPTVLYDWAYVSAMERNDPRIQLYNFFKAKVDINKPINIALIASDQLNYFLVRPTLDIYNNAIRFDNLEESQLSTCNDQYLLFYAFEASHYSLANDRLKKFTESGKFEFIQSFENPIKLNGYIFKFPNNPHDLVYPFPTIYLLKVINKLH